MPSSRPNTLGALRRKVKSRKLVYDSSLVQEYSADEVLPYEEVVKIAPQNNRPRPILLVSAHSEIQAQAVVNHIILNQPQSLFSLPGRRSQLSSPAAHSNVVSVHEVLQAMDTGKTSIFSIPPQVRLCMHQLDTVTMLCPKSCTVHIGRFVRVSLLLQ